MKIILLLSTFLIGLSAYAGEFIPYQINKESIVHCKSDYQLNGKQPQRASILPWSKTESGLDSFIVALNDEGKEIYRFGNKKGQSFDSIDEKEIALNQLIKNGTCPETSEL